jgi:MFS transporter, putative metabolite:H+ symporter
MTTGHGQKNRNIQRTTLALLSEVPAAAWILVLVAALGYFVDIYDLILFSVVRTKSLKSLGLADADITSQGMLLLNLQMTGMLVGGVVFGVLGDRLGRLSVLFGSILLYSSANFANAFVDTTFWYGVLRFTAGFGLAGELGAGVTLVSETLPRHLRGVGTTIVAAVGVSGALLAWWVASSFDWRAAYVVGGVMGLLLLLLRVKVAESSMFKRAADHGVSRGKFFQLFNSWSRFKRFIGCVLIGMPLWYTVGVLVTLSPEFAKALEVEGLVEGGRAISFCYGGLVVGDFASGFLSQMMRSRRRAIMVFLLMLLAFILGYFQLHGISADSYYWVCAVVGFGSGYWAMFATVAAEQFGTNLRATVATSAPNFVRGSLVLISGAFLYLKPSMGILNAGLIVGLGVMALSFLGVSLIRETFSEDLDFFEVDEVPL